MEEDIVFLLNERKRERQKQTEREKEKEQSKTVFLTVKICAFHLALLSIISERYN